MASESDGSGKQARKLRRLRHENNFHESKKQQATEQRTRQAASSPHPGCIALWPYGRDSYAGDLVVARTTGAVDDAASPPTKKYNFTPYKTHRKAEPSKLKQTARR